MRALWLIPLGALVACTTPADELRPQWQAYATQRCQYLKDNDGWERCVIEQVDRCAAQHRANLDGLLASTGDSDCQP